ncbi:hypothetical protein J4714_12230 [Staphylococcus epidermidis]|nr:hypothetical protein [Staphylococcus epidermidis]
MEDGELDSYISGQSEIRKRKKLFSKTGNDGKIVLSHGNAQSVQLTLVGVNYCMTFNITR